MDEADVSSLDSLRRKLSAASGEKISFLEGVKVTTESGWVLLRPDRVAPRLHLHAEGADIAAALKKLAGSSQAFISRGDKSGTHAAELRLWKTAGVDVAATKPTGYRECGCGMGPALNMAASTNAYVLADRGTWLSFKNRGDLAIVVEGDKTLFNQYGVMVVNPAKHPHVKATAAQRFADWVVSPTGQAAIAGYKIGGEQLFFPNAKP
jgi:tungstate transport system substrate-binding protein